MSDDIGTSNMEVSENDEWETIQQELFNRDLRLQDDYYFQEEYDFQRKVAELNAAADQPVECLEDDEES